jgi:chromosome segregation ATPase
MRKKISSAVILFVFSMMYTQEKTFAVRLKEELGDEESISLNYKLKNPLSVEVKKKEKTHTVEESELSENQDKEDAKYEKFKESLKRVDKQNDMQTPKNKTQEEEDETFNAKELKNSINESESKDLEEETIEKLKESNKRVKELEETIEKLKESNKRVKELEETIEKLKEKEELESYTISVVAGRLAGNNLKEPTPLHINTINWLKNFLPGVFVFNKE